jgi:hypothetical protein
MVQIKYTVLSKKQHKLQESTELSIKICYFFGYIYYLFVEK